MRFSRNAAAVGFHEWPLIFFTSLAIIGAGLISGHFAAWALEWIPWQPRTPQVVLGTILLAAGLLISLVHLGKPGRALLALRRSGRSRLSTEILLASATVLFSAAALILPLPVAAQFPLWGAVAVGAPAFLLSLGWVYRLPGQLWWQGSAALSPLLLGLAIGALAEAVSVADRGGILSGALLLLILDAAGFGMRWFGLKWELLLGEPAYPPVFSNRRKILFLRLADVTVLPVLILMAQAITAAAFVLAFGIFVDRYSFYALAVRRTTESEIARVEKTLRAGTGVKKLPQK